MASTKKQKATKASPAPVTFEHVPLETLHENTWNPNQQSERAFEAEKESIDTFGFIDPITVRAHPDIKGEWQIVDGAHRYRALTQLGHTDPVPIAIIDVTEAQAKRLTIILNETRGAADRVDLAALLADLSAEVGVDELRRGLPFDEDELDGLLKLADFDFDNFKLSDPPSAGGEDDPADEWATIPMRVPASVVELWEQARERIEGEVDTPPHDVVEVRNGMALEAMLADFLAGS